jgi:cation diffusion facilitator family transporter
VSSDSTRTVWFSLGCDLAIAVSKFIAAGFSGSSAMLSEGIHSVVDSMNGVLLLWGRHASRRKADEEHPFGYGMALYFWTLIVALLIFAAGGGMSIYDGISSLRQGGRTTEPGAWTYAVLAVSAIFEGATVWIAAKNFRKTEGDRGFWKSIHTSKDPTVFTVLLDNIAAILGVAIAFLGITLGQALHMPELDGIASILIGALLAAVATVMAAESKGLLIGEGMDKQTLESIRQMAHRVPGVVRVGGPMTMYFGPRSILLALDVEFEKGLSAEQVTATVDQLESSVRARYPNIQRIFIEAESLSRAKG